MAWYLNGVFARKKSMQHLACNWESQRQKVFSQTIGMFDAAGDLEGTFSPPVAPRQSPGGARGKVPENF